MNLRIALPHKVQSKFMKLLRPLLVCVIACTTVLACANPKILEKFKETYGKPKADCTVCHTQPPKRNEYGKAVEAALAQSGANEITAQDFQSIEKSDADGDSISNGDEIRADTMPGDAKSKPVQKASETPKKDEGSELIPKHSLHPAIIHFPIALLAVAGLLQILSVRNSDEIYHKASVINLAVALICSIGAIVTGVAAWLRLGYVVEGNLLIHLILASTSILIGLAAYIHREKPTYLWLIAASGILVLIAGHFGGTMVYG